MASDSIEHGQGKNSKPAKQHALYLSVVLIPPQYFRLSKSAVPGENSLYLQDAVNWESGQEIVIVTTAMRDSRDWHRNEVHVIDSVQTSNMPSAEVKSIVDLTSTIQYDHIGTCEFGLSKTFLIDD